MIEFAEGFASCAVIVATLGGMFWYGYTTGKNGH